MGTPDFALPALEALIRSGHAPVAVVTQPDRPKGRGRRLVSPPVKESAEKHQIRVLQPEDASAESFMTAVREMKSDMIIVAAFGQILKKPILEIPPWGVINIHASLLPKYRGAAPIQHAVLNDDPETGLTIMQMEEGLDTGPILYQESVPIRSDETAGSLHDRLAALAGDLTARFLEMMKEAPPTGKPQDPAKATYAPKITKEMTVIDWARPADRITPLIRALDPVPGAWTTWEGKRIKLFGSTVIDAQIISTVPGRVAEAHESLYIEAGKGIVGVREIQYPGKKRMPVYDFLQGFPLKRGTVLGG